MDDYIIRMQIELYDLELKINSLRYYLNAMKDDDGGSSKMRDYLNECVTQLAFMEDYRYSLTRRLKMAKEGLN